MTATAEKKLEGRHVLYMLLGFFGFMFAVNGVFVYFALSSFSGLSTEDAYAKGLNYNAALAEQEAQTARGWKASLDVVNETDGRVAISLTLVDQDGQAVDIRSATGVLRRPAISGQDIEVVLMQKEGRAETVLSLPALGNWDLNLVIDAGEFETPFRVEKRLWVK